MSGPPLLNIKVTTIVVWLRSSERTREAQVQGAESAADRPDTQKTPQLEIVSSLSMGLTNSSVKPWFSKV